MVQNSTDKWFYPGQVWLDTDGKKIQAHGGSVFYLDGVYYWYGENKEKTDGKNGIWTWGISFYSSTDLLHWKDEGVIIQPDLADEDSPLNPYHAKLDRPHLIFNEKTKKYVCWVKIMNEDGTQSETILTADSILGPYRIVRKNLRPLGMSAGDFDLAVAPDGKGYYFFERVHSELISADLTEDYTDVTGYYQTHFPKLYPPFVREGVTHFVRAGKHYLLTSGTTGYLPNSSQAAVGDSWHGPYKVLGDPHPLDDSHTSYHSQISSVFKVEGKRDLYIALADRWRPDLMNLPYEQYAKWFQQMFDGSLSADEKQQLNRKMRAMGAADEMAPTCDSEYVWLPIRFVDPCKEYPDGMVFIDWKDQWSLDEYE